MDGLEVVGVVTDPDEEGCVADDGVLEGAGVCVLGGCDDDSLCDVVWLVSDVDDWDELLLPNTPSTNINTIIAPDNKSAINTDRFSLIADQNPQYECYIYGRLWPGVAVEALASSLAVHR